jgi:hypothetical protein
MEDPSGAPTDGAVAAPFSELIRDWLDEGDRLDESAMATVASAPAVIETRGRRLLGRLRPVVARHRVLVMAGLGLIPFALFALTDHSAAAPASAMVLSASVRAAAPPVRAVPPPPSAAPIALALPPTFPDPPAESFGFCEQAPALAPVGELRSPDPRPAPHHHHHHHHPSAKQPAACGLHGPCAVTRAIPKGTRAASAVSARPGPAPGTRTASVVSARPGLTPARGPARR